MPHHCCNHLYYVCNKPSDIMDGNVTPPPGTRFLLRGPRNKPGFWSQEDDRAERVKKNYREK